MWLLRAVGWILLFGCLAVLAGDAITALQSGAFRLAATGELWTRFDGDSLNAFQVFVEQNIAPWLWANAIEPLLLAPAFVVLLVPAIVLLLLTRRRKRQKFF